jgi:drug/metabolite transporter (DMT)-like permease
VPVYLEGQQTLQERTIKRLLAYAAIYILWGASFLGIRIVVHAMPPFLAAGIRFFSAGLVLVLYSLATRKPLPQGQQWRNLLILAITLFVGDYALLFWAEQRLPSGIAAVTAATIPVQIFLLEWLWLRRVRLTALTGIGLLLGAAGVAVLVLPAGIFTGQQRLDRYAAIGLIAASFWSFGTILSTRFALPKERTVSAGWQMALGGTALLLLSATTGEWSRFHASEITPRVLLGMGYLICFASIAAFSAYGYLLGREPTGRVASYAYVNPVIALLLGAGLAGESLSLRQEIACAVIIAGVMVTLLGKKPVEP